jgi:N-formylglutamate deformylase
MSLVFRIPHASKFIPEEYLQFFNLSKELLDEELLLMTDHYTDELFSVSKVTAERVVFPVSRLLVDPERFESDVDEPMSEVGMGCVYRLTHNGRALKNPDQIRERLIEEFYRPHHQKLTVCVIVTFETGGAEIQRRIWPIWLVDTRRRFCGVASAGVQGSVV